MVEGILAREVKKVEFKMGDLFYALTKTLKAGEKLETNKKRTKFFDTPATSSATTDNGIGFYVHGKSHNILSGVLTVTSNGVNAGTMFFQPWDFAIAQDSYALLDKSGKMTKNVCLYILSVFNSVIKAKYNYVNKSGWKKVSKETITLPVAEDGTPDWDYMNDYMIAIQKKHLDQVESYNRRNELILKKAHPEIDAQEGLDEPEGGFREFKMGDLFYALTKTLKAGEKLETNKKRTKFFDTPATSSATTDNGIGFYVHGKSHNILSGVLTVTSNGVNSGTMFFQPWNFAIAQDSYALSDKSGKMTKSACLYIMSIFNSVIKAKYNYVNKSGWKRVSNDTITLPVAEDGTPDWDYMEQYMNRILNAQRESEELRHRKEEAIMRKLISPREN